MDPHFDNLRILFFSEQNDNLDFSFPLVPFSPLICALCAIVNSVLGREAGWTPSSRTPRPLSDVRHSLRGSTQGSHLRARCIIFSIIRRQDVDCQGDQNAVTLEAFIPGIFTPNVSLNYLSQTWRARLRSFGILMGLLGEQSLFFL